MKHCEGDEECIDGLPSRWQPMAAKVLSEINGLHAGREALRDELRDHVRTEDERQKNFEELLHGHVLEADRVYRPLLRETRAAVDRIAERSITRDDLFRAMRWIGALITAMVAALGWMFANVDELHTFVHRVFT